MIDTDIITNIIIGKSQEEETHEKMIFRNFSYAKVHSFDDNGRPKTTDFTQEVLPTGYLSLVDGLEIGDKVIIADLGKERFIFAKIFYR